MMSLRASIPPRWCHFQPGEGKNARGAAGSSGGLDGGDGSAAALARLVLVITSAPEIRGTMTHSSVLLVD